MNAGSSVGEVEVRRRMRGMSAADNECTNPETANSLS